MPARRQPRAAFERSDRLADQIGKASCPRRQRLERQEQQGANCSFLGPSAQLRAALSHWRPLSAEPLLGIICFNRNNASDSIFFDCATLAGFLLGHLIERRISSARVDPCFLKWSQHFLWSLVLASWSPMLSTHIDRKASRFFLSYCPDPRQHRVTGGCTVSAWPPGKVIGPMSVRCQPLVGRKPRASFVSAPCATAGSSTVFAISISDIANANPSIEYLLVPSQIER
jgi:hypothetical protein